MHVSRTLRGAMSGLSKGAAAPARVSASLPHMVPVGALTSKPYAFTARPWELKSTEGIDVFDALGSNIQVDSYGKEVKRILPRTNELINEDFISDKVRFNYDGYANQRISNPMVRVDGELRQADWEPAMKAIKAQFDKPGATVEGRFGGLVDREALAGFKDLMDRLGATVSGPAPLNFVLGQDFIFNTTMQGIDSADAVLLIGCNPRHEAPMMNVRFRRNVIYNSMWVGSIGPHSDLTYKVHSLGNTHRALLDLIEGKGPAAEALRKAQRPMIVLGMSALSRADGASWATAAKKLAEQIKVYQPDWNGFNVLHGHASSVAALQLGLGGRPAPKKSDKGSGPRILYLLDYDDAEINRADYDFVIYQGHHGDVNAALADVVLPGAAPVEKEGTYVNTEGRVQRTRFVRPAPGQARNDFEIVEAVGMFIGKYPKTSNLAEILASSKPAAPGKFEPKATLQFEDTPITSWLGDFYLSDSISRSSHVMALTSSRLRRKSNFNTKV